MFNKEMTLLSKEDPIVVMTVGAKETSFKAMTYGYKSDKDVGSLNKVPYWVSTDTHLTGLYEVYDGQFDDYKTWITVSKKLQKPINLSATIRDKTIWLGTDSEMNLRFEWLFNFSSIVGQQIVVTFDPPPDGYI